MTITASLPPHSARNGVSVSAHTAMTFRAVPGDPVNATLSTPDRASASPVAAAPVTVVSSAACSGAAESNSSASSTPVPGVSSDGLNTTALPAARAYPMEPIGV